MKIFKYFFNLFLRIIKFFGKLVHENGLFGYFVVGVIGIYLFGFYYFYEVLSFQVGFVDPASSFANSLIDLYNKIWFYLILVLFIVFILLIRVSYLFIWNSNFFFFKYIRNIISYCLHRVLYMRHLFMARTKMFRSFVIFNMLNNKAIKLNIWYTNDSRYIDMPWRRPFKKMEKFLKVNDIVDHKKLELSWCVLPIYVLSSIAYPSISFVHTIDPAIDPIYVVKVVGRQWYWNYSFDGIITITDKTSNLYKQTDEYLHIHNYITKINNLTSYDVFFGDPYQDGLDFINKIPFVKPVIHVSYNFDSIMKLEGDLIEGTHRLLEVDNRVVLPLGVPIRLIITSIDVIHSWSMPALGLKVDAVPGRLNQFIIEVTRPGIYFGQCSELCGPLHGFMPIIITVVPPVEFENWLLKVGKINH